MASMGKRCARVWMFAVPPMFAMNLFLLGNNEMTMDTATLHSLHSALSIEVKCGY